MKYKVTHVTRYSGTEPISVGHNQAWLKPRTLAYQTHSGYALEIEPKPSIRSTRDDTFGNTLETFSFNEGYRELTVTARSEVTVTRVKGPLPASAGWEMVRKQLREHRTDAEFTALHFNSDSPLAHAFDDAEAFARLSFTPDRPVAVAAADLMRRVHQEFKFDPHATTVSTPVTQVFQLRKGVCQDFAHVMLSMLRSLGVAARYVSGYIRTFPKAGQERLVGADASHAWVSVFCGAEIGWIDFDPTNNVVAHEDHITVAWGRDYADVPPLRGVYLGGGQPSLHVSVDVEPLSE